MTPFSPSYTPRQLSDWENRILREAQKKASEAPPSSVPRDSLVKYYAEELAERFPRSSMGNVYLNTHLMIQPILEIFTESMSLNSTADLKDKEITLKKVEHPIFGTYFPNGKSLRFANLYAISDHPAQTHSFTTLQAKCIADITIGSLQLKNHQFELLSSKERSCFIIRIPLPALQSKISPDGLAKFPNAKEVTEHDLLAARYGIGMQYFYLNTVLKIEYTMGTMQIPHEGLSR